MDQKIAVDVFLRHKDHLIKALPEDVDGFFILSGKEEGSIKPKTKAVYVWLFGYDMIETIFLITRKSIFYLASNKKIQMMDEIQNKIGSKLQLFQKQQANQPIFEKIYAQLQTDISKQNNIKLLSLTDEKQQGALQQEWQTFIQNKFDLLNAHDFVLDLLSVKDNTEIQYMTQSSQLTCHLMKKLILQIENSIDQSIKVRHTDLAAKVEKIIEQDKNKFLQAFKLQDGSYDLAFTPVIQSGGNYNVQSNSQLLSTDVIIIQLATLVNEYNTMCHRTLIIDPTDKQKHLYNALLEIQAKIISFLVPGKILSDVYNQAIQAWQESVPIKGFGYSMGLELQEHLISPNSKHVIREHEIYFVTVSVENVPGGQKNINYNMQIGDMVLVNSGTTQVLTQQISKAYKNISYQLQDEEDEEEEKQVVQPTTIRSERGKGPRNQQIQLQRQNEKQRQKHQDELKLKKQTELEERLAKDQFSKEYQQNKALELENLNCYRSVEQLPREAKKGLIYIDNHKAAILLPFQGSHLVVHVSCIKNVSKIDEGKSGPSLRINFFTTETSSSHIQFPTFENQVVFIKELQYRSRTVTRIQELITQIKGLQKKVKAEQQVEREKQTTGELDPLILNRGGRKPVFKDLKIRPTLASGKGNGHLEVHTNGFRYIYNNREMVDIVFKNIKHFVYQPPEHEIIAAIHLHLFNPIIVGKKKCQDVQFYCEVGGGVEHLEGKRKNRNDDDEMEDEERLRIQRRKMGKEFEAFIKSIEEVGSDFKIKFEKPYRDLGFEGNWNRARIQFQPTMNTLMSVVETPFFILTLNEVEIACFERVMPGIKSFDLSFIFKNYEKPVLRLESIEIKDLEGIKNWLDRMNILFFEVAQNLVWKNILQTISKDIAGFVEDGGWGTVLGESDDEEEHAQILSEEEGDSEFAPEGDEESEFSEEDEEVDDDDASVDQDDDDDDDDDEAISDVIDMDNLSEEDSEIDDYKRKSKGGSGAKQQQQSSHKKNNLKQRRK